MKVAAIAFALLGLQLAGCEASMGRAEPTAPIFTAALNAYRNGDVGAFQQARDDLAKIAAPGLAGCGPETADQRSAAHEGAMLDALEVSARPDASDEMRLFIFAQALTPVAPVVLTPDACGSPPAQQSNLVTLMGLDHIWQADLKAKDGPEFDAKMLAAFRSLSTDADLKRQHDLAPEEGHP